MSVRPGFAELIHQTTMNWPVPRKNGKRRPGVGKRQRFTYIKIKHLLRGAEYSARLQP